MIECGNSKCAIVNTRQDGRTGEDARPSHEPVLLTPEGCPRRIRAKRRQWFASSFQESPKRDAVVDTHACAQNAQVWGRSAR